MLDIRMTELGPRNRHRHRFTYSPLRNLSADQSSSMATIRTLSNPASPSTAHPESRLNSHLYRFDVPLGYAIHRIASPSAFAVNSLDARSSSACVMANAMAKSTFFTFAGSRTTRTESSFASSGSNDADAFTTTISVWSFRFSFLSNAEIVMMSLQSALRPTRSAEHHPPTPKTSRRIRHNP